jgi:hypothetical protein
MLNSDNVPFRRQLQRSPLRLRHLEGPHQGLRPKGRQSLRRVVQHPGVEDINNITKALKKVTPGTKK